MEYGEFMKRRKQLLTELKQAINQSNGPDKAELCFKILYGLPIELHIDLACLVMRRYLPIFHANCPDVTWPKQILDDVAKWARIEGRGVPNEPKNLDAADAAFSFAFDGLLLGYAYRDDNFTLTSSCTYAIFKAIHARKNNIWIADDPHGYWLWEHQELHFHPEHCSGRNPAVIAVGQREWGVVADWLEQAEVWNYPDTVDVAHMEQELARWVAREMTLILPQVEWERLRRKP